MRIHADGVDREMTTQEEKEHLAYIAKCDEKIKEQAQMIAAQIAVKESAKAKLAALGLTEAEVNALIGGA